MTAIFCESYLEVNA